MAQKTHKRQLTHPYIVSQARQLMIVIGDNMGYGNLAEDRPVCGK